MYAEGVRTIPGTIRNGKSKIKTPQPSEKAGTKVGNKATHRGRTHGLVAAAKLMLIIRMLIKILTAFMASYSKINF